MSPPLLVCRTAWMDHYRGVTSQDTPTGGGSWVTAHGFGHEAFNFEPVAGDYFGYVQPMGEGINLTRLGGASGDERVDGVTVVWVATHPTERGPRVVGWYRNATVFAAFQEPIERKGRQLPDGSAPRFLVRAAEAVLLDRDERVFEVPRGKGGIGQSNVWYPDETASEPILKYVEGQDQQPSTPDHGRPHLMDLERRLRIERTAMEAAADWFVGRGYEIEDVSMERLGWDLEARRTRTELKVEVKGTSLAIDAFVVEVTPNEYGKMTSEEHRASYRLCVVTSCEEAPLTTVFAWSKESEAWTSGDGLRRLEIEERTSARITPAP